MKELFTSIDKVQKYEVLMPLLVSLNEEFKELTRKKPEASVSKSKILIVNRLLKDVRFILEKEESLIYLDLIEEDSIPQVSDITIMLSQYLTSMKSFRKNYFREINGVMDWAVKKKT